MTHGGRAGVDRTEAALVGTPEGAVGATPVGVDHREPGNAGIDPPADREADPEEDGAMVDGGGMTVADAAPDAMNALPLRARHRCSPAGISRCCRIPAVWTKWPI